MAGASRSEASGVGGGTLRPRCFVIRHSSFGFSHSLACASANLFQNCVDSVEQSVHLGLRANGDAEIISRGRVLEPPDKNFSCAEFFQPDSSRKTNRPSQNKIRLAGENIEALSLQLAAEIVPVGNNPLEVVFVIVQMVQSGFGGDLAESIDVIAIPNAV